MILNGMVDLRPMLPGDVDAATEMILSNDWGVRREWLALATTQPSCCPIVAIDDGAIVGTGIGTANGSVGWIGTIFLEPVWRGQGIGRAITQSIIDRLEAAGCRTLVLVATADGRRLYARMGFEPQTRYRIFEAPGLVEPDATDAPSTVRPFAPDDLDAIIAIDREGTGEDRAHLLGRLAAPGTARVAIGAEGEVDGFVVRAPWGGGATVARSTDSAMALIAARRATAGPGGRVMVGVLQENDDGVARLVEAGFTPRWSAPRMIRGEPMTWRPERIWGQFNHAVG
jgi:GNAT superfamily N-acetyltransferase